MSNQKPSEDSSRRNFLGAAAVVASAAVAAPTAANAQTVKAKQGPNGIKRMRNGAEITTPDFQLAPDAIPGIAQVIVDLWLNKSLRDEVLKRETSGANKGMATANAVKQATLAINAAAPRYNFTRAVIITEEEHDNGYTMQTEDDVVFVLPKETRIDPAGANLLSSAKLLMACTPNGI